MPIKRPKSLRELALEYLRKSIIDGTLKMGQILSERKISEELGVSKSPVREALAQLRDEGLINIEPQKGARVFSLSDDEVSQICDFRLAIEMAAFELALSRNNKALSEDMAQIVKRMITERSRGNEQAYLELDTTFHQIIFEHAGNDYLTASYTRFIGKIAALRTHLSKLPKHTDLSFEEHQDISIAVLKGDLSQIKSLLVKHIDRTRSAYKNASIVHEVMSTH